jgi:hypothetical protein
LVFEVQLLDIVKPGAAQGPQQPQK